MDSFLFAVNAVSPIILMVALGYILKRVGFMNEGFAKLANRLVFRVFLPAMLFLNLYKIGIDEGGEVVSLSDIELTYVFYTLVALTVIFLIALPIVMLLTKRQERRGVVLQAAFRSNYALIGLPLVQSLCPNSEALGLAVATVLSAVTIPLLNILAVISLSVFREGKDRRINVGKILLEIVRNPLILGVAAGLAALGIRALLAHLGVDFSIKEDLSPVYTVLGYLSQAATPMSLIVLGAQFEFSAVASLKREITAGVLMRNLIVPVVGLGAAFLLKDALGFEGVHFAAFVAMFATPVAVSSVPMAQEMKSDAALAGQLVVWTTLMSALSVFLAAFLLKAGGVFG